MRTSICKPGAAVWLLALTFAVSGANKVLAQPNEAQVAAIKSNCRSDYMSFC